MDSKNWEDVKQKLMQSKKLDELISKLQQFNLKLKNLDTKEYKKQEIKLSPEKTTITMPYKYKFLAEVFKNVDIVYRNMYNSTERITYSKLKPVVEEMLKRNLYEKYLAQIKTIYSEAYELKFEELNDDKKQRKLIVNMPIQIKENEITEEILLARRKRMYENIIKQTKIYHQEFLQSLTPPMDISLENIRRWHPEFKLEEVPDIEFLYELNFPKPINKEKIEPQVKLINLINKSSKHKLIKSYKLDELKASLLRFTEAKNKLKNIETCEKVKETDLRLQKPGLKLPYKYQFLFELFQIVDKACQSMFDKHSSTISLSFSKLKQAVEDLSKKNLQEIHLSQIKSIYPQAFSFKFESNCELIINIPLLNLSKETLHFRQRKLYNNLIYKVYFYHQEFLQSLTPLIDVPFNKITRWHPEFDVENVPDIKQFINIPKVLKFERQININNKVLGLPKVLKEEIYRRKTANKATFIMSNVLVA